MFLARRIWILLFLGFASGLPLALTTSTLSAWYTETGMSLTSIGMLTLVGQPYIYKFIWAPLLDRFDIFGLGRRRSWMIATQIPLALCLFWMSTLSPPDHPVLMPFLALLVAFFSASQDITISGYLTEAPKADERGLAVSFYNTAYRLALIFAGALALIMAQYFGWHLTYLTMAITMLLMIIASYFTPEPEIKTEPLTLKKTFVQPFSELWQRFGGKTLLLILVIALLYKLTDAFALSLSSVFFLRELNYTLVEVGSINKVFGVIFSIAGGLAAGLWMKRMRLFTALIVFGLIQSFVNLAFIWLYLDGHTITHLAIAMCIDSFGSALGSVAFTVMLMSFCNKEFAGTQFALLSAITAFGRVYTGPIAAVTVEKLGWVNFFAISIAIGVISTGLLFFIRKLIIETS